MSLWLSLLAFPVVLQQGLGLAAGASFSGSLERVGTGSISIRLADRRVIDAMLPDTPFLEPSTIAAKYSLGDQVEVTCKSIPPVWEEGTSRYQSMEVTGIRLLRHASPQELSKTEAAARQPIPDADSSAPGGKELAHARQVSLAYAANLPNFVADERAKRFRMGPSSSTWRDFDVIESEIAFKGNHAARQQIRRDGKPWERPFNALPGFIWYEGFGTEIRPLFDPKCPTKLDYAGRTKKSGRALLDYRFSSPVDGCFPFFYFDYQRFDPARTGHVFIDDPGGSIIQLDEQATGFPREMQFSEREEHISWDYVKIGAETHLLPVRANFLVRYYDGTRYRIEVEYKNHRHFEASSNITFDK